MATYIIRAGLAGPVKIGKADDVEARREALQTAHHETLHVLRVIDTPFDAEPVFHQRFAEAHIRGEWFEFREEMLTLVPTEPARATLPVTGTSFAEVFVNWTDKEVAWRIGCSPATVKKWRKGECGPNFKQFVSMMNDPDLWRLVLTAAGRRDLAYHPETIAALKLAIGGSGDLREEVQPAAPAVPRSR